MNDTLDQVLVWGGGIAISLTQVLAGILFKRLWSQVDDNTKGIDVVRTDFQKLRTEIAERHPTHSEFLESFRALEKQMERGFDVVKSNIDDLKQQQTRIFDKLDNKQDKK